MPLYIMPNLTGKENANQELTLLEYFIAHSTSLPIDKVLGMMKCDTSTGLTDYMLKDIAEIQAQYKVSEAKAIIKELNKIA